MATQPMTRRSATVLIALANCAAMQMAGFVMFLPLFALRFESFGTGVQALGASAMAYALASSIATPFIGMLADRLGRRPVILISLAANVLVFSGYLLASTAWLLILLRGLAGVFAAGLLPTLISIVGDLAPEDRRGQWVGMVNGGASIGWVVGPLVGGLLYDRYGYVVPFGASIAMAAGALLLAAFRIPETHAPAAHPGARPRRAPRWHALPERATFLLLLLIVFGAMFAWAFVEPQFMFHAYDDLGWTSTRLGSVISAFGLAFMLGAFALGQLSDRFGRKPVLVLGLALFSAQFIGLAVFRDATWIMMTFCLAGLGNALYDPPLSAMFLDIAPPEHIAGMMGLKSSAGSLGNLLGPALVLLLAPFVGPQAVFLLGAAMVWLIMLAAAFTLRVPQRNEIGPQFSNAAVPRGDT